MYHLVTRHSMPLSLPPRRKSTNLALALMLCVIVGEPPFDHRDPSYYYPHTTNLALALMLCVIVGEPPFDYR